MALGRISAVAALALLCTSSVMAQTKICIDPGHGGSDPGAVGGGQTEQANVLDTGLRFRTWLNTDTADTAGGGSWNVLMTRTTDVDVSLAGRTTFANSNSAARFLSIHNNAASATSANGIETFCWGSGSATSFDLRNKVQEEAILAWPLTNRGNKTANFYVIVNTNMPAELHEMGFITNTADRAYLGSATQRDLHARSEMYAVQRNLGLAKYTPSTAVVVTADNVAGSFTASTAWFPGTSIAGYIGANYSARATESISDPATWNLSLPSAGTYRVDAIWTAATNRAAAAPYQVIHTGGTTTVNKNQQATGGSWQSLGNFSFNAGTNNVRLSCWTTLGFFVVADAVRFTKL
jgi:N-acetylmuramoyl-L-alanine amidase